MKIGKRLTVNQGLYAMQKAAGPKLANLIGGLRDLNESTRRGRIAREKVIRYSLIAFAIQRGASSGGTFAELIAFIVQWIKDHPEEVEALIKLLIELITSLIGV